MSILEILLLIFNALAEFMLIFKGVLRIGAPPSDLISANAEVWKWLGREKMDKKWCNNFT